VKVETQHHGTVAVVVPHGPLVRDEIEDLRRALETTLETKAGRVVIDMSHVPWLDSAGIETLAAAAQAEDYPHPPRVAALNETCREALELTNVLATLDTFDTVENAIRSFKR